MSEIRTPSSATETTIRSHKADHSASIMSHKALLEAQIDILSKEATPKWVTDCARVILSDVRFRPHDAVGIGAKKKDEPSTTAVFHSILQFYSPRTEVSDKPEVLWLHQFRGIDVSGVRYQPGREKSGYEPRVFMEFALSSTMGNDKVSQLFSYVNNSVQEVEKRRWLVALGVLVKLNEVGGTIELFAYHTINEGIRWKLATVKLFAGSWDASTVGRLVWTLYKFVSRNPDEFNYPANFREISMNNNNSNVMINDDATFVYKVFDNRYKIQKSRRQWLASKQNIEGCEVVIASDDTDTAEMAILKYPYIQGSHLPEDSQQVATCVVALRSLHEAGLVHCDIRASNIIFRPAGSKIIDFDFTAKTADAVYPSTFNLKIPDGERHHGVSREGCATQEHDCYALGAVLSLVVPTDETDRELWNAVIANTKLGQLSDVINSLEERIFKLVPVKKHLDFRPTGSPKLKKNCGGQK